MTYGCHNYDPTPAVITKGRGAEVWDVDGKRYIDCLGGYSSVNQGHCHPKIRQAAIEQMERVTMTSRAFFNDRLGPWEKYLTQLIGYDKVCFMNGGVEGSETSVKFARRWGYSAKGIPDGQATIVFPKHNFWGRSIAACASSDDPKRFHKFGPFNGLNFELVDYGDANALEEIFKANPNVAGFMFEPLQGEAGVVLPPPGYFKKVRDLCTKYKVLMIADEVQTGLGRTGKLMGMDWEEGVKPDIVAMGKSLSGGYYPIAACLADDWIMEHIHPGDHGSTFGGNPLSAAIGMAAVQVVVDEKLADNARDQGNFIHKSMTELRKKHPFMTDFRGRGLFLAMELDKKYKKSAREFNLRMCEEGLLSQVTKENKIRITPPLVVSRPLAQEIVDKLEKIMKTF
jgi:ornithine--oxo-acid transaminase